MSNKAIVLDANILIRAVLGTRVRELILKNAAIVKFLSPDVAYADARKYLRALLEKRTVAFVPCLGCDGDTVNFPGHRQVLSNCQESERCFLFTQVQRLAWCRCLARIPEAILRCQTIEADFEELPRTRVDAANVGRR